MRKWDNLSMREKAEMMKVAVSNGITTLPEIKQAYNEFAEGGAMPEAQPAENDGWSMDGNLFGGGGYKPSERIKQRIAHYEGKAMTGATDPLSGKWAKNNSFESEAKNFYNALPRDIREQVLSNPELADSLYSYSYNVGAGRFKERVVPALRNYYNGKGTVQDIENSMWASGDSKLRGLQRRRAEERKGVRNALIGDVPYLPSDTPSYPTIYDMPQYIPAQPQAFSAPLTSYQPVMLPDEQQPIVREAMAYDPKEIERQERQRGLNNFMTLMSMTSPQESGNPYLDTIGMLAGNQFKKGGRIYIKPKNRGKFTKLKERTGHSATWFKKHGLGGNLFDGTTEDSQQMSRPNIYRYNDGRYVYQAAPDAEEIEVSPINTLLPNPSQWTYQDASGKLYTPHTAQVDTGSIIQDEERNPLVRAANNYFREAAYRAKDGTLALQGKYTMPAIAASALLPLAGEAAYPLLTNPYIDAAATSAFAGHGLNHAINEGIDGWGDAAMTALELAPLGQLAKPLWNAGKEGLQYTAKIADNTARYMSPSYDLYRTVGETTPSVRVRDPYIDIKGLRGTDKSYIKIKSSLENLADAKRGNKNEAYYLFAPKDIDILKLRNARFGNGKAYDGPILGSGSVDGKFVSYGEPWMEFAPSEKTALYEMPTGPRRGPNLMATDFRGNRMDYSVNEAYNAVLRDRQFHQDIKNMELGDILQFKRDNYPDLIGGIPTDIYHANQTVIPNKNWNFDKFLKTPLWKYSEDAASGQVQKELMMKWPETKPLETPTIEWADAAKTPQITAENAASMAPKVNWDADNWFKTISGRNSYSAEEAAELASHVPEYREIERRLFDEGKLTIDSKGDIIVNGSEMSPQEYIMRQSEAFQKMNPEHHYVGVSKKLRDTFENEARDPATRNRYDVWTDRKSPKNVEEYAISQQGGYTNASQIEKVENQMSIREENHELHKEQLKWKLEHGKISQETYDRDLASLEDNYSIKQKEDGEELKVLSQQEALDPLNGGKVFDVTYPRNAAEAPVVDAEGNHWHSIPYLTVQRDAPVLTSHYQPYDPVNTTVQTDQLVTASRRHGYGVTHIDNVKDTYDGTMLNETIIGRGTPVKSVLGNTGTFDIESPNKWKLYRSLLPPFLGLGAAGTLYGKQE